MRKMNFYDADEWSGPSGPYPGTCFKRSFRWLFVIPGICADGVDSLPPLKIDNIDFSYKEMQAEHLNETIYFPSKPEFSPIKLTLYDIQKTKENPIFTWIKRVYNPKYCSYWKPALTDPTIKVGICYLVRYNGCGEEMERWVFEHAWPKSASFYGGNMESDDHVT